MHIVSCSDNKYVMPLGVAMTSVMANTKGEIIYHVISDGITPENKRHLNLCAKQFGQTVYFYDIPHTLLERLPVRKNGYLSVAAYIRLFVADILPKEISKVLYLDCDIIANSSLEELWKTDITDYSAGVVVDSIADDSFFARLGYDKHYKYFNSGVMLINLEYWRVNAIQQRCLEFISKHFDKIVCEDQDVLNAVLHNSSLYMPLRYNAVCTVFYKRPQFSIELSKEIEDGINAPVIVHFTYIKPWFYECNHPMSSLFFKYQTLTPWKDAPKQYFFKGWKKYKFIVKGWLQKMGIVKPSYTPYINVEL